MTDPLLRLRRLSAALVLPLAATALVACGGSDSAATASDAGGSTTAATAAATPTRSSGGDGSGGTLVIGSTGATLPNPDTLIGGNGWEGTRFVANQIYDQLVRWDLTDDAAVPRIVPSLATSWRTDSAGTTWTLELRRDVRFHDGTPFDADAVVFNFDRYLDDRSEFFSEATIGDVGLYAGLFAGARKVGPYSVEITTRGRDGHFLNDLTYIPIASPAGVRKSGNAGFARAPVGSGPFRFASQSSQQLELVRNAGYWAGAPKLDKLILKPLPDASARIAALRSGEVNWIEYPNPDDVPGLRDAGFQIVSNNYDHVWQITFDQSQRPWDDVRVRQAANYAVDREAIANDLLHGTADPAEQVAPRGTFAYDPAGDRYAYDPEKARALLAEAGYGDGVKVTIAVPTGGSGNLIPIPIAEKIQQDLRAVGIDAELKTADFDTLMKFMAEGRVALGASAQAGSTPLFASDAIFALSVKSDSPWFVGNPTGRSVDALVDRAAATVDDGAREQTYAEAARALTEEARFLTVVNDRNSRALAPTVHGFVQPQSWFLDLTQVWVGQ
ncbi:ABC transporter substrate-binding protein [Conexibacter sp. JD483]|uniref:ABC transporter substrate-binding protein n=1 Tax=unclassified Conexibacter TaxID=2627773 RepID=UPI0027228001|nr:MULTISPECIES: ABC transporter substrate-binding protein [unclassified Conexibacter]MDO8186506.1 ABC transporter substrate-binding protein [Conexibacter sp. CPCC 205706]MDO8200075.1 ABC transporter substrate-binding protein [Conexibacter sp. CPCC 205762]MDR9372206.1 ABC transporter substrate-binding protein [Conexibacter sp. JD483]